MNDEKFFSIIKRNLSKNRGLTFVELLIAIVLLVVLLGPMMRTMIAAIKVNADSRKVLCATEVGRGVMEGLSGNSFNGVLSSYEADLGNGNRLAQICGDVYNKQDNIKKTNGALFNNVTCNLVSVTTNNGTYNSKKIAEGDKTVINELLSEYGKYSIEKYGITNEQMLLMHGDKEGKDANCLFFTYTNVHWGSVSANEGFVFDVVCAMVPAANSSTDKFYPYSLVVGVYPVEGGVHKCTNAGTTPLLTMTGGMRNE